MPRFIALPVSQGDAFYLEGKNFSVLVDGGRNSSNFASLFKEATKTNRVDIVICTHNDADHANGILGFLEDGLICKEVWLPGKWLKVLPDVLRPFVQVFSELENEVAAILEGDFAAILENEVAAILEDDFAAIEKWRYWKFPKADSDLLEAYAKHITVLEESEAYTEQIAASKKIEANAEQTAIPKDGWPEKYHQQLEQAEPWEFPLGEVGWVWLSNWYILSQAGRQLKRRGISLWEILAYRQYILSQAGRQLKRWEISLWEILAYRQYILSQAGMQLLLSAIEAAARIRNIAIAAFHRGIPVRWFEINVTNPGGGLPVLQPLNSHQIAKVYPRKDLFLKWLALTVSNKESLVFWSPATRDHPGVLFTADSDLANVKLPRPLNGAIVTSPHHGSEANANAYQVLGAKTLRSVKWVRSDGRYSTRPGNTYLSLSPRFCTMCRCENGHFTRKQAVRLHTRNGVWVRSPGCQPCSCK